MTPAERIQARARGRWGDLTNEQRLWSYVPQRGAECWTWTGPNDRYGYGLAQWEGRGRLVHRVVYELLVGPIPVGLTLDHLCRNKRCVNPKHLEPVTNAENVRRDAIARAPVFEARTRCRRGHPFPPYVPGAHRVCLTCHRARRNEYMRHYRRRVAA